MRTDEEVKKLFEERFRTVLKEVEDKKLLFEATGPEGNNSRKTERVERSDTRRSGSRFEPELRSVEQNTKCFNDFNQAQEKFKKITGIEYDSKKQIGDYTTEAIENQSKLAREFADKAQPSIDKVSSEQKKVADLKTTLEARLEAHKKNSSSITWANPLAKLKSFKVSDEIEKELMVAQKNLMATKSKYIGKLNTLIADYESKGLIDPMGIIRDLKTPTRERSNRLKGMDDISNALRNQSQNNPSGQAKPILTQKNVDTAHQGKEQLSTIAENIKINETKTDDEKKSNEFKP